MLLTTAATQDFVYENDRAENFILDDNLPESASILLEIIDRSPRNSRAFNNLGVIAWKQDNWYDAFGLFKHALELQPDYADAASNLFDLALKTRRIEEVRDLLLQAAALLPSNEELEDIALGLHEEGDNIYFCGRALQQGYYHPDLAEADALVLDGKLVEASALYFKVLDEQGDLAEVYNGLGVINFYEKRYSDAFALFTEALKRNPCNKDMFMNLFDAAHETDQVKHAVDIYYTCRKEYPQLVEMEDLVPKYSLL